MLDASALLRAARVPSLIDEVAATQPAALAVSAPDRSLTYGELDARSSELADELISLGAAGQLVGLCMERSAALIVAALAIIKAGAAYVALDPKDPDDRLHGMLHDAGAGLAVLSPGVAERLRIPLVPTTSTATEVARLADVSLTFDADPAYVTFTSGSTGRPKGVLVEHAGLINLVRWHGTAFDVTPRDRCTQIATPGFDAFAWEVWSTLAHGAALYVVPEELRTDPVRLRDWLVDERITVSFAPTPLAEELLRLPWPDDVALRYLLTGGDRLRRRPPVGLPFRLINNYGVTEASVVSTSGEVRPDGDDRPSIGRPIDGVDVRVVDDAMNDVAAGESGELLIGGVSVAWGYVGADELTAERFVTVANGPANTRWYRTGDVVRVNDDGELDYIARKDDQIQLRGRRVEPAEIIAALDAHPSVARSEVVVSASDDVEPLVVAYLQPVNGAVPDDAQLRNHLGRLLPPYMYPSAFVWMDELPLTSSGKIDRQALRSTAVPDAGADCRAPEGELEVAIAAIVEDLLNVVDVKADDNLFLLGGHSLLVAQLVVRLGERFGVEMALRDVFEHPTVAQIAAGVQRLLIAEIAGLSEDEAARMVDSTTAT